MTVPADTPAAVKAAEEVNPADFDGSVRSDNKIPSAETLKKIADLPILDREGKAQPFKSLYAEPGHTLIVFVRHFFCGNCQEYLRILSEAIPAAALATAPVPTRIVAIGCGDPSLIDMYAEASASQYPIYADPTRALYDALGMVCSLALGTAPGYMRHTSMLASSLRSVLQGLRMIPRGLALKGGNQRQIGGEFLFETTAGVEAASVVWCHRMRTTRDHCEPVEIRDVLRLTEPQADAKPEATRAAA